MSKKFQPVFRRPWLHHVSCFSWYLFLCHSALILVDAVVEWVSRPAYSIGSVPERHNILIAAGNVALVVLVGYVVQKDFRAPYFQALNRIWRERKRIPISHSITLDGTVLPATDLSALGRFVREPGSRRAAGSRGALSSAMESLNIECSGQVMRVTGDGVDIRFPPPAHQIVVA
jgi:hypothetical protein